MKIIKTSRTLRSFILLLLFLISLYLFYKYQFQLHKQKYGRSSHRLAKIEDPKQIIIIIIDSLRKDYIAKIPFFEEVKKKYPDQSYLTVCQAALPTMTTQRIEALMTGSNFFASPNIIKTFLSSKIEVDSIPQQLKLNNFSAAVFGDDTWVRLFDFQYHQVCQNSYDIHDFDSCDAKVYRYLSQAIVKHEPNNSNLKYKLLIGHFLSIDHIGHATSSITSPKITSKLTQISTFLKHLLNIMENDTMIIITGDHGMRSDGNHGGSSQEQIQTLLFAYLKGNKALTKIKQQTIQQIDLATTISLLLNLPIPLNSKGFPILQLLASENKTPKQLSQIYQNLQVHYLQLLQFYGLKLTDSEQKLIKEQRENIEVNIEKNNNLFQKLTVIVKNRLSFLQFSSVNSNATIGSLIFMMIIVICLFMNIYHHQLHQIVQGSIKIKIGYLFQIILCFSLFFVYFSWNLMKNISTLLLIFLIAYLFFASVLPFNTQQNKFYLKFVNPIAIILFYAILAQIQGGEIREYSNNFFKIQFLSDLFYHQTFINCLHCFALIIYFKRKKHLICITQKRQENIVTKVNVQLLFKFLVVILNFMIQINPSSKNIYYLRTYTIILILVWIVYEVTTLGTIKRAQDTKISTFNSIQFLVVNFLSIFIGKFALIIFTISYLISRQIRHYKNYTILMGMLSEWIWCLLGNRYQFSSLDIRRSYIFQQQYDQILNFASLIIYFMSPYLLLFLRNIQIQNELYFQNTLKLNLSQSIQQHREQQQFLKKKSSHTLSTQFEFNKIQLSQQICNQNCKFIALIVFGCASCAINVWINNEKILFTVVYVPLIFLNTVKCVMLILICFCYFTANIFRFKSEHKISTGKEKEENDSI